MGTETVGHEVDWWHLGLMHRPRSILNHRTALAGPGSGLKKRIAGMDKYGCVRGFGVDRVELIQCIPELGIDHIRQPDKID